MARIIHLILFASPFVLLTLFYFLILSVTQAHEAPTGWKYPIACCSNKDCKQISDVEVRPVATGWLIQTTGEVIAFGDSKLRDSPDGLYHRCARSADFSPDGHTLCLFVPPMGF